MVALPDDILRRVCFFLQAPVPARSVQAWNPGKRVHYGQATLVTLMRVSRVSA